MGRIGLSVRRAALVSVLLACLFPAAAGAVQRPLPASNYSTEAVCGQPLPGRASCLAYGLVPETRAARSHSHPIGITLAEAPTHGEAAEGVYGLRPEDLHNAYELPLDAPGTQTIGIVDAYDDPTIEADLQVYDEEFGLPACTHANGCFTKLNQEGHAAPLPVTNAGWATEITLDVEIAHAVCQNCKIVLVEANSNAWGNLGAAVETAVAAGADEVSNSYGGVSGFETSAYDHPGVVITASTGDGGYDNWEESGPFAGNYPATSPYVVAVGGTELGPFTDSWAGESAWSGAGSGCSTISGQAPSWQTALPNWTAVDCGSDRAVADIAADADPFSGVAIYDSTPYSVYFPGWATFGGTSLAAPIVASAFALAGGSHGVDYPAETVYANRGGSGLHDIVSGSNWPEEDCEGAPICSAGTGWDGPTGVGSPHGLGALLPATAAEPTVTSISPTEGPIAGGTTVTLEGTHLGEISMVEFGAGYFAPVDEVEEGRVTTTSPAHPVGTVQVFARGPQDANAVLYKYVVPMHSLTVQMSGSGEGTVTISPGEIFCATDCVQSFEEGTTVTLSPESESNSVFTGWSGGGCSGTDSCQFTIGGDTTVTANFVRTTTGFPPIDIPPPHSPPAENPPVTVTAPVTPASPVEEATKGDAAALAGCLAAAKKAYRHAVRLAHSARGGHAAALHKAKRIEARREAACRKRF